MILEQSYLDRIRPEDYKHRTSDKYSFNLWRFLGQVIGQDINLVFHPLCDPGVEFNSDLSLNPKHIIFWSGMKNISLFDIIVHGYGLPKMQGYLTKLQNFQDITNWFFEEYARVGRAIIDRDGSQFMFGDDIRWDVQADGKHRVCRWSGITQELQEYVVTRTRWVSIAVEPATCGNCARSVWTCRRWIRLCSVDGNEVHVHAGGSCARFIRETCQEKRYSDLKLENQEL